MMINCLNFNPRIKRGPKSHLSREIGIWLLGTGIQFLYCSSLAITQICIKNSSIRAFSNQSFGAKIARQPIQFDQRYGGRFDGKDFLWSSTSDDVGTPRLASPTTCLTHGGTNISHERQSQKIISVDGLLKKKGRILFY